MRVLGGPMRRGKPLAIEDALEHATGAIVVVSDANTLLPKGALSALVAPFQNPKVGAVAGEKRVISDNSLTGEGESLYWRYESFIKRHMSQVFGCIGTVGELYAVRRDLYPRLRPNSYFLSEDLMVSMEILRLPSQVVYVPEAYSLELPALNLWEEFKRKVRVAAASFSVLRTYPDWLHFWKHPHLFFHFFSYKLLRWYGVPLSIPVFFISNVFLLKDGLLPQFIMALQVVFYLFTALGLAGVRGKVFGLPAYFMMANVAQILGVLRYFREYKSGKPYWQKIQRKSL
jgi:cellulose synthase/poly-beta-1,6-N-acetylglucosamine synthase-like glycosyltransferase